MTTTTRSPAKALLLLLLFNCLSAVAFGGTAIWQEQHDQLVARLRALAKKEDAFGPAYRPLYHAALPWYERWGGRVQHPVDDWMAPPETYAAELADALEHGRNFFAENPEALLPLAFEAKLPDGRTITANYWIILPTGFPEPGRRFPLVIGLHGSGWLAHPISFVRKTRQSVAVRRAFEVTPINEGGPWQIDFLNAYLDELLAMLPVDQDRVYVQGHSLGAMATWEWAMNNPERFAAISPRSGIGEPFRASRLRDMPAWVIHGAHDAVVPTGCSDQMVTALQSCGGRVRYSVLPKVEHNMPADLDEEQVKDWYFGQTRSHEPPPPDPRDALGLTPAGYSPWIVIAEPGGRFWTSETPVMMQDREASRSAVLALFKKAHDLGELADAPLQEETNLKTHSVKFWLAVPKSLQPNPSIEATAVDRPPRKFARFFFRGETDRALAHLAAVAAEAQAAGHRLRPGIAWIIPLSLRPGTATHIAEYRIEVD